jgi:hypothetical protein
VESLGGKGIELVLHPAAFRGSRYIKLSDGRRLRLSPERSRERKARPGRPRAKNLEREQREAARAKERAAVLKEAKKIEAEDLKARLRAQETPPTDTWAVPPKYEIVGRAKD